MALSLPRAPHISSSAYLLGTLVLSDNYRNSLGRAGWVIGRWRFIILLTRFENGNNKEQNTFLKSDFNGHDLYLIHKQVFKQGDKSILCSEITVCFYS